MESVLPKLIPDAISAAALLTAFIIFLKDRREWNRTLKSISDSCHQRQKESQQAFENSLNRILDMATRDIRSIDRKLDRVVKG